LKREGPGLYRDAEGGIWRLAPVTRTYEGKKGPIWFLQKIEAGKARYQSGVFETKKPDTLSADYLDSMQCKHYLDIMKLDGGEVLKFKARAQ
jgi:hypothetical protein